MRKLVGAFGNPFVNQLGAGFLVVTGKSMSLRSSKEVAIRCGRSDRIVELCHLIKRLLQAVTTKKIIALA